MSKDRQNINKNAIKRTQKLKMSVSEQDILRNLLIDRTSFEDSISLSTFRRLFPKGTNYTLIESIYKHLTKVSKKRYRAVEKEISEYLKEIEQTQKKLTDDEFVEIEETDTIRQINKKFDVLNQILDDELESAELQHKNELDKINQRNLELGDIILPGKSEYPEDLDEPLDSILKLLKSLQKE